MLNQVVLAGRLVNEPVMEEKESRKVVTITVAVPRSYKNLDGTYDTDFIKCRLWSAIADNCYEYCKKGDIVGIKGRIQTTTIEKESGEKEYSMEIICEKLSFLSTRKTGEYDEV